MEKEVQCAWCEETVVPQVKIVNKENGNVKERRCPKCSGILAAYLEEERLVLEKVRSFRD